MIISNFKKIKSLIDKSELLIFDFDGVLANSVEVKTRAFALLYKPYGEKVVEKVLEHHTANEGISRFDKISYYHQNFLGQKIDKNKLIELADYFSTLVKDKVIASPEISDAGNFLELYCSGKKKCVINSATPMKEIREIVAARSMNVFFLEVLGSPSTKVDNLKKLLETQSSVDNKALFFGDSESDLQAAEEVGIKFIGVGAKMFDILSYRKGVFYHINDFVEIIK